MKVRRTMMKRMSKKLYVGALVATFLLAFLSLIPVLVFVMFRPGSYWLQLRLDLDTWQKTNLAILSLAGLAVAVFLITQFVLTLILLYKMWSAIQDGNARTTPGKAIGFLFIPGFSLYWIFQVWGGFPTDYNGYLERHRLRLPQVRAGLYVAYPVLLVLSVVPVLNILTALAGVFVLIALAGKTCDAVNQLAEASQNAHGFSANKFNPRIVASSAFSAFQIL